MVALGDVIDIVTELLDSIGGKAGGIYLTKNAVQAGRLGLDRLVLGNEVLLFKDGGFSFASHIRQFVFLFIPIDVRFLHVPVKKVSQCLAGTAAADGGCIC